MEKIDEDIKAVCLYVDSGCLRSCLERHSGLSCEQVDILLTLIKKAYKKNVPYFKVRGGYPYAVACEQYTKSYGDGSPRNSCRVCGRTREEHGLKPIGA